MEKYSDKHPQENKQNNIKQQLSVLKNPSKVKVTDKNPSIINTPKNLDKLKAVSNQNASIVDILPECTSNSTMSYTNAVIYFFGFEWDCSNKVYVSRRNALQRVGGYSSLFDMASTLLGMVIDVEPILFTYGGYNWMIELWKGQYFTATGCEIGIYTECPPGSGNYKCATDAQMMYMSYTLKSVAGGETKSTTDDSQCHIADLASGTCDADPGFDSATCLYIAKSPPIPGQCYSTTANQCANDNQCHFLPFGSTSDTGGAANCVMHGTQSYCVSAPQCSTDDQCHINAGGCSSDTGGAWNCCYSFPASCNCKSTCPDKAVSEINVPCTISGNVCVSDQKTSMNTNNTPSNQTIFSRNGKHWWLTGFKPGICNWPNKLLMDDIKIVFPDAGMATIFYTALVGHFQNKSEYKMKMVNKTTVGFAWQATMAQQFNLDKRSAYMELNCQLVPLINSLTGGDYSPENIQKIFDQVIEFLLDSCNFQSVKDFFTQSKDISDIITKWVNDHGSNIMMSIYQIFQLIENKLPATLKLGQKLNGFLCSIFPSSPTCK